MKKIINGKLYNTDTARQIGSWDNNITDRLYWVSETLYQKQRGEFFLPPSGKDDHRQDLVRALGPSCPSLRQYDPEILPGDR